MFRPIAGTWLHRYPLEECQILPRQHPPAGLCQGNRLVRERGRGWVDAIMNGLSRFTMAAWVARARVHRAHRRRGTASRATLSSWVRNPGCPRGCAGLRSRRGRQRAAGPANIAPTWDNISVGRPALPFKSVRKSSSQRTLCWREMDSNFRFRARRNREILVSRRSSTDLVWLRPPEGLGALAPRVEEFGDAGSCYLLLTINKGTV